MWPDRLPKLCGADVELGNFVLGVEQPGGTGYEASRALLREIDGLPRCAEPRARCVCPACLGRRVSPLAWGFPNRPLEDGGAAPYLPGLDPQDWGRKFLPANGGCVYIDLDHLELCLPEVRSAWEHVACWHAMLRIAQTALVAANSRQPPGRTIQVLVNNSDGLGNSYGSHLGFLLTRRAWDNIFHRKLHYLAFLSAYQASSIVFTGQGKVGSENGAPAVEFQLSQRADFFETVSGPQTTYHRPLVNSRDEPLCGAGSSLMGDPRDGGMARLHVIFFDNTLCPVACLLKVGVMQIVLAMIEAGYVSLKLALDDPLAAVLRWSHDPQLEATAGLASGEELTAVELQLLFFEQASDFVAEGGCENVVPRAGEILALWEDTLRKLQAGDLAPLSSRLDWVLKWTLLQRARRQRPGLRWDAPELKHLDQMYANLDPREGLFWTMASSGLVEPVVSEAEIARFVSEPPTDTRAWARAMLLRRAGADAVSDVDWDSIRFNLDGRALRSRRLEMADPLAFTRGELKHVLDRRCSLDALLDAVETAVRPRKVEPPDEVA